MNYYIITGVSKGLGLSIASKLMRDNNVIFGISRTRNKKLIEEAYIKDIQYRQYDFDLSETHMLEPLMTEIFSHINQKDIESITLINNAATIGPIQPTSKNTSSDIAKHMNINLVAPMALTSAMMHRAKQYECKLRVVNVSSGASTKPIYGWNCYCASKAGLDMFGKVVAIENDEEQVKVLTFSPGIMDTNMQGAIRESGEEDFKDVKKFRIFKDEGHLQETSVVAKKLVDLMEDDTYKSGTFISVYDL